MSQYLQTPPPGQIPGAQPPVAPLAPKKSGCFKWVLIAVGVLVLLVVIGAFMGDGETKSTGKPVDPAVTLEQAEANIIGSSSGVAYSNSDAGREMAAQFSALFKAIAQEGTDSIKDRHDFITHCQLNDDSVLFIVHVPKLRKFDDESKELFCEYGWQIAHKVLAENGTSPGVKLAVGVKGIVLYENIYSGLYNPANLVAEDQGIAKKSKDSDDLEAFFTAPPAL